MIREQNPGSSLYQADSSVGKESGILSDIQILERLVADDPFLIFVSPVIDPARQLGPSSLDLRLGTELTVIKNIAKTHFDLTPSETDIEDEVKEYFEVRKVGTKGTFVLHPGEFALAPTLEFLHLPLDIAGRLEGRSTYGRLGFQVHATAGFVDPGFRGTLSFELINSGKLPVRLTPGIRLGQICFFKVGEVQIGYMEKEDSKYGDKMGAEHPQLHKEPEISRPT